MAELNVTWSDQNGDFPDPIDFDATDEQIIGWAEEAIRGGDISGIDADPDVDLEGFVVRRFAAKDGNPDRVYLTPKVPVGGRRS